MADRVDATSLMTNRNPANANLPLAATSTIGDAARSLVDLPALAEAVDALQPVNLQPGEILIRQGEVSDAANFLKQGTVRVAAETSYGLVPLATIAAPQLIGEIGVLAGLPRTASIEATTPVTVFRLDRNALLGIGEKAPEFLITIIGQLGQQLDSVNRAVGLYTNALAALEKRAFDPRILEDLASPPPQLQEFSDTFRRFAGEIIDKRQRHDELASAAIIQQSFLPKLPSLDAIAGNIDICARMRPAKNVGGDFYDFFMLDHDHLAIAIGDVCGKGIPASMFMAVVVTVLRAAAHEHRDVAATIAKANAILCRDNAASMFATLFYAVLDIRTGVVQYCNCGHSAPIHLLPTGQRNSLMPTGLPLGLFPDRQATISTITVDASSTLVMFTDGVTEAMNADEREFGEKALIEIMTVSPTVAPDAMVSRIFAAVDTFAKDAPQADDITCVVLRRRT